MSDIIIYHNPACGTSRNTLAMIRNAGIEPQVIEYLKTPPTRDELISLIERLAIPVRALLREKEPAFHTLGLDATTASDALLIDAMLEHPVLMNRPIVTSPRGARLCRPAEQVLELLPTVD